MRESQRVALFTLSIYAENEKAARQGRIKAYVLSPVMLSTGQARAVARLLLRARARLLEGVRERVL